MMVTGGVQNCICKSHGQKRLARGVL